MSAVARVLRAGIRLYQRAFGWRPSPCRFHPSCSAYAIEAIEIHGALRGAALALRRVVRCQPWGGFGMDPVPPRSGATAATRPPATDDIGVRIHV